jgi:predicted O-linked N-acetylglucosamine transferase (SPINDLY family)
MSNNHNQPTLTQEQINSVMTLYSSGQLSEAIAEIKALNEAYPNVPLLFNILGACYQAQGLLVESVKMFETATKIKPDYAEAHFNLGVVLKANGQLEDAIESYKKAIYLVPNYPAAHNNLGNIYKDLNQLDDAIRSYQKALTFKPDFFEVYNNLGLVLFKIGEFIQAEKNYRKALSINSNYFDSNFNLGNLLRDTNRRKEALLCYQKAREVKPSANYILGNVIHTKMHLCQWDDLQIQIDEVLKGIRNDSKVIGPFALTALLDSPSYILKATEIYVNHRYPRNNFFPDLNRNLKQKKIRLGYFSGDFNNHPVSTLTAELYEIHNRDKFEVHAFSFGKNTNDFMNMRIRSAVDQFHEVESLSDQEIVKLSRSLKIDIAIDLAGFTQGSRTGVFAMLAAPLQLSYIGYLGSMGADYYDYLIADKTIIPIEKQRFYKEKIIYLPHFQANDSKEKYNSDNFVRQDFGLPNDAFVFCCFNNTYKITPETFDAWARILNNVKNSILMVFASNDVAENNLKKEIISRGVNENRLFFGGQLSRSKYLARFKLADLFLDTSPYNAGTTASDALRVGLPVLTCMGESFASRMCASILKAANLDELITNSHLEYELLAIDLANNPSKLMKIKNNLINNIASSPLFKTNEFIKNLELAYQIIYDRYYDSLEPDHVIVESP